MRLDNFIKEGTPEQYKGVPVDDIPVEDLWIAMSKGNKKLDKKIKTFNLPAIKSCLNSGECAKFCYARKAEWLYPGTRDSRNRNWRLAKENTKLLKTLILKQIKKEDVIRIHEAGDFISQDYIDMWTEIAKERPNNIFYGYTKVFSMFDFTKLQALPNVNIINSLPGGMKNFGKEEEITIRAKEMGVPLCPCKKGNDVHCGVDCSICWTEPVVLFIQH